jgi:choline dehydrogenase-like flavoprotein
MLTDARQLPDGTRLEADLCIIGGGMAGITIARELMGSGARILVLESGGEEPSREAQDFCRGSGVLGDPDGRTIDAGTFLVNSRVRAFGGSGHVWGGKCGRLEATDFEARPWIAQSGWPFGREALDPFYDRACRLLKLPSFRDDLFAKDAARPVFAMGRGSAFETVARFHSPVSGGHRKAEFDEFRYAITRADSVRACLHAHVREIRVAASGRAVTELDVRTLAGTTLTAAARHFVLATGGIENARLLLLSRSTVPGGVGNAHGLVGRYFAGHANAAATAGAKGPTSGVVFSSLPNSFDLYTTSDLAVVWGIWNMTRSAQHARRLPNFWASFTAPWYAVPPADRAVGRFAASIDRKSADAAHPFVPVRCMLEEPPNADSRVFLSSTHTDRLGLPRAHLEWRLGEPYMRGMNEAVRALAQSVGVTGAGRLRWPIRRDALLRSLTPARHHMGTTRMHDDMRHGVVDRHCRVHGMENLHIAGSSVFPTPGIVNPTLTLLALAIRLADRLRTTMAGA